MPCWRVPADPRSPLTVPSACLKFQGPGVQDGQRVWEAGLQAALRQPWGAPDSSLSPLSKASSLSQPPPHPRKGVWAW